MPTSQDYEKLIAGGLAPTSHPKKVIVVGAGMAGLVAAYELKRAGHKPVVLEAQPRVGGRVRTLRDVFTHGLYAEVGAMRIPRVHKLTLAYIDKFGLKTNDFTMGNPQAYYHIGGKKLRMEQARKHPDLLGFDVAEHERGQTAGQLWAKTIQPLVDEIEKNGDAAWEAIVARYDEYSTREFLEINGWSEGAIEMFGLIENQEALMNSSFLELFREEAGRFYTDMVEIEGGMDRLPRAFLPGLAGDIRFGARMIAIDQSPDSVTVHYQTPTGRFQETGDYAILTAPFPVLRHIEALKPFTRPKQRAIRELHYDASAKILFQCRRRFWEQDEGIFGGGTITDLPVRNVYYPDHGRATGRGIMLASYTWAEAAHARAG
jgi:monoamine oxidase